MLKMPSNSKKTDHPCQLEMVEVSDISIYKLVGPFLNSFVDIIFIIQLLCPCP